MTELNIIELAEKQRQDSLNSTAIAKAYRDAKPITFKGEEVYASGTVNTSHFKGIELFTGSNPSFSRSVVSARLWHTVKRPGRPAIRVYSKIVYGLTIEHLISVVNGMPPKRVMDKIGHVLKIQEKSSQPRPKLVGVSA